MNDKTESGIHWSFWVIGVITLIWNLMGVVNYFAQMNPEILAGYRASELAIVKGRPTWATVGFAAAVFGGSIGCLLLLLRQSAGFYFFILSFLGVIATTIHTVSAGVAFSTGEIIGIIVLPFAIAAFLIWYHRYSQHRGWVK